MHIVKQIWTARHKLARLLRYTLHLLFHSRPLRHPASGKIVYVHLTSAMRYRYFEQILRTLKACGYSIYYFVATFDDLIRLGRLEGDVFWTSGVVITAALPAKQDTYTFCCDDDNDRLLQLNWKSVFKLEFDISKPSHLLPSSIFIPFSVHDYIYRCCFRDRDRLLQNPKKIRLLFAGSYKGYQNGPIGRRLGKLERQEIVDTFRTFEKTTVIASEDDLNALLAGPRSTRYYWVDTDRFRIPPERWLEVLSYVEVFLCPPGVVTPMSYNAVEAMAMGAVPLINYGEWFHPDLIESQTCLSFGDKASLLEQLNSICHLSDGDLCRLRAQVLDYYDRFLQLDSVVARINQCHDRVVHLTMDIEKAEYIEGIDQCSLAIAVD